MDDIDVFEINEAFASQVSSGAGGFVFNRWSLHVKVETDTRRFIVAAVAEIRKRIRAGSEFCFSPHNSDF